MPTFDELKKNGIGFMSEYEDFYYVRPKKLQYYDNTMYKVNKHDGTVELFDSMIYGFKPVSNGKTLEELAEVIIEPNFEIETLS